MKGSYTVYQEEKQAVENYFKTQRGHGKPKRFTIAINRPKHTKHIHRTVVEKEDEEEEEEDGMNVEEEDDAEDKDREQDEEDASVGVGGCAGDAGGGSGNGDGNPSVGHLGRVCQPKNLFPSPLWEQQLWRADTVVHQCCGGK